jgi:hypothetical protein
MATQTITLPADTSIVSLGKTPYLGGQGRNGKAHIAVPAAGVMLQGHDQGGNVAPAAGDAGWYNLLTTATTSAKVQEIVLPRWIRRGAAGGTDPITIEGIQ